MGIKRWTASKDTSITNAFNESLLTRGTGSNMGESDILETFSIYAQASSASLEAMRILVEFPVNSILQERNSGNIPASGNVEFYLKLSNAEHGETLPRQFYLVSYPVSQSWQEGTGLDMETFLDVTRDGEGANWINAKASTPWTTPGGDYISNLEAKQFFDTGVEDLELDITHFVEAWLNNDLENNGIGVFLTGSQEGGNKSFYTKRFFARGSEFFFKRPVLEARWDSTIKDNRGNFTISSSLLPPENNVNTIYLYNHFNGMPVNIPSVGSGPIFVSLYTSASGGEQIGTVVTGGLAAPGIYSASFALSTTASVVYDRWFKNTDVFHTGTIVLNTYKASEVNLESKQYVNSITNLKSTYSNKEVARFRLFSRKKNWKQTLYRVASTHIENEIIDNVYFKIMRFGDKVDVVPYGTGSFNHTRLSYDEKGSYFDLDLSMLEPDYMYGIKFLFYINSRFEEQSEVFKFRVMDI